MSTDDDLRVTEAVFIIFNARCKKKTDQRENTVSAELKILFLNFFGGVEGLKNVSAVSSLGRMV